MRAGQVAVIALVAAALGGLVVLGGVALFGVGDEGDTVTLSTVEDDGAQAAPAVKPQLGNEFDPAQIYRRRSPGVVTIYSLFDEQPTSGDDEHAAQGSGFVVSREGYLLTSSHVISTAGENQPTKMAKRVYVAFRDNDRVDAEVVGIDLNDDVGVLKLNPDDHALTPVPLGDSSKVVVGEPVAAIGSPFGNTDSLAVGVVSSNSRSIPSLTSSFNVVDAIQTDAPITHGNSGGPLLDSQGRVIGINAQIRSESGDSEGVGFAIPINAAKRSMKQLIENGRVAYAYVGVTAGTLTPTLAERFDYRVDRGAVVDRIAVDSPGLRAGLRCGRDPELFRGVQFKKGADVIVAIDGRPVRSADDLVRIVSERLEPGQQSDFEIVRGGERKTVAVRLAERPRGAAAYACS
ncbi:MAG TPA: trypsin-like peptidase domain-containing protein [Gaiellaceae bacterium]|nr:trypsin-like peptidase domain-containing protein [Gaiellaceae bacterium]